MQSNLYNGYLCVGLATMACMVLEEGELSVQKCSVSVFALFEDAHGLAVFKSAGSVRYARSTCGYAEFAPFGDVYVNV